MTDLDKIEKILFEYIEYGFQDSSFELVQQISYEDIHNLIKKYRTAEKTLDYFKEIINQDFRLLPECSQGLKCHASLMRLHQAETKEIFDMELEYASALKVHIGSLRGGLES